MSSLAAELFVDCKKTFSRIKLSYLFSNPYYHWPHWLRPRSNNVEKKLYQRCFSVVSTSDTDVVSTLCNVENLTSDFVLFSTSDQSYFNVDPKQ